MNAASPILKHDTDAAIRFLKARTGFPVITTVKIDKVTGQQGAVITRSFPGFHTDSKVEANAWAFVESAQGEANVYYSINPTINPEAKKASRENIANVVSFHVDLDPKPEEDQDAALVRLTKELQAYRLPPTWIIASGGGVQGIWDLRPDEWIPIDGNVPAAEEAKLHNIQLERELGGDNCHNIDRIMRLPGTVNCPNTKKRSKGRRYAPSSIVKHTNVQYCVADFPKASPAGGKVAKRTTVTVSGNVTRVLDLFTHDETKGLKSWVIRVLMDGYDAQGEKAWKSRSEAVFACACEMVRSDVSDEVMYSIFTDPDYKISESVLTKKNVEREVTRVIGRAREFANGAAFPDGCNKAKIPYATYGNTRAAIHALGLRCLYDAFNERLTVESHDIDQLSGEFSDHVVTVIRNEIYNRFKFYPHADHARDALTVACRENRFNSVTDEIDALVWDGTPRLDRLLPDYLGADDTPFNQIIGRKTLVGAVRRARIPGCKNDSVLVLEGKEDIGKSMFCKDLAGCEERYADAKILGLDGQKHQELLQGKWIYEIAELDGMKRAGADAVKAFVTTTHDLGRPAYGRLAINRPRTCIFIGTTNKNQYLTSPHGNRRFWPVLVRRYDREAFQRDRDQLLAEAAHYESQGEALYLPPDMKVVAAEKQASRMVEDGLTDVLAGVPGTITRGMAHIHTVQLLEALRINPKDATRAEMARIKAAMLGLGWDGPKYIRIGKAVARGYARPATVEPVQTEAF